jgi:hypothetical protein
MLKGRNAYNAPVLKRAMIPTFFLRLNCNFATKYNGTSRSAGSSTMPNTSSATNDAIWLPQSPWTLGFHCAAIGRHIKQTSSTDEIPCAIQRHTTIIKTRQRPSPTPKITSRKQELDMLIKAPQRDHSISLMSRDYARISQYLEHTICICTFATAATFCCSKSH